MEHDTLQGLQAKQEQYHGWAIHIKFILGTAALGILTGHWEGTILCNLRAFAGCEHCVSSFSTFSFRKPSTLRSSGHILWNMQSGMVSSYAMLSSFAFSVSVPGQFCSVTIMSAETSVCIDFTVKVLRMRRAQSNCSYLNLRLVSMVGYLTCTCGSRFSHLLHSVPQAGRVSLDCLVWSLPQFLQRFCCDHLECVHWMVRRCVPDLHVCILYHMGYRCFKFVVHFACSSIASFGFPMGS